MYEFTYVFIGIFLVLVLINCIYFSNVTSKYYMEITYIYIWVFGLVSC